MKWKFRLPKSPISVYYLAKLYGLAPFTLKKNRFYPARLWDKLYSTALAAFCLFVVSIILFTSNEQHPEGFAKSSLKLNIRMLRIASHHLLTAFALITFVLMHKNFVYIGNKLCTINNDLGDLGVKEDHGKYFRNLFLTIAMINGFVCTITIVAKVNIKNSMHIATICDGVVYIINWNTIFIYVSVMLYIRHRFGAVNDRLRNMFKVALRSTVSVVSSNPEDETSVNRLGDIDRIRKLEELHLELSELVDRTTKLFGPTIFLHIANQCVSVVVSSYWLYYEIFNWGNAHSEEDLPDTMAILLGLFWVTAVTTKLFVIAYAASSTCQEGNTINFVLIKVWNNYKPAELKQEFLMFSLQLLHKPITVSVFGFFNLDYSYIYKIFNTAVAYLVIMIQLDASRTASVN